jgi:hypothetical protein
MRFSEMKEAVTDKAGQRALTDPESSEKEDATHIAHVSATGKSE